MTKLLLKHIRRPAFQRNGTSESGTVRVAGVLLDAKRQRQDLAAAIEDSIALNRAALLKLARR